MKNTLSIQLKAILFSGLWFSLPLSLPAQKGPITEHLKVENLVNPVGLDEKNPRFSWRIKSSRRNTTQSAYELEVHLGPSFTKGQALWSSGKTVSSESLFIPYKGAALQPSTCYYWRVRIWDDQGKRSPWSKVSYWTTGLLAPDNWKAEWIAYAGKEQENRPSPFFRKGFNLKGKSVKSALLHVTARGMYIPYLNGKKVGEDFFTPGWTSYHHRIQYQSYDVKDMLNQEDNALGVVLGNGWYRGYIGFQDQKDYYGHELSLLLQLNIRYDDGSEDTIISDRTWHSNPGPLLSSELYHGEVYDSRRELVGWNTTNFNDGDWKKVKVLPAPQAEIVATINEPVKKQEKITPLAIITTPKGEKVLDFGQNLVGTVGFQVKGNPGDSVVLRHAEVLDKAGNFYTDNLRNARQEVCYILKGNDEEYYQPNFTFQGFRYVHVKKYPGDIIKDNFRAWVLHSDIKPTGHFQTSNPLINQLQKNIQWGQKGNFLDVPTDCPQRDERLGWTGDAQVFFKTAAFNFDVKNFFSKWLTDLSLDQKDNGSVPYVVPNALGDNTFGSAGWGDAATIIPWQLYQVYGDKRRLEQHYPSMKAWVEYMRRESKDYLWQKGFHFGDWLFYRPDDDNSGRAAVTDKYLIAQCFFAHSTQNLIHAAQTLGFNEDVDEYSQLLSKIKKAFLNEYLTPNGRLVSGTQTAYVLALHFDMLPEELRQRAADRLEQNIHAYNKHITTGFLGTPYICHVLTRFGKEDLAYDLLLQKSYPSWLYPVTRGATTIWERWDGIKPDSTFQTPTMNSFNHYAYGAIGDWMYQHLAGIQCDAPACKKVVIQPKPGGGFTHVKGSYQSPYGTVGASWSMKDNRITLSVEVPPNTSATVFIPDAAGQAVKENGQSLKKAKGVLKVWEQEGNKVIEIGSGNYQFESEME